jgi:outer membrane lipase/esterase
MSVHTPSHDPRPASLTRRSLLRAGAASGLAASVGASALLAACGSGDIVSALSPTRFISFGDGISDVGQGGSRYTINDGTVNIWSEKLAGRYGRSLSAQVAGGLGFAQGHAVGQALPRTLAQQIDAFLASNTFTTTDVVLINLPMTDVLTPLAAVKAGTLSESAALAQIDATGRAHVTQVRRLIAAGAKHIVTIGVYDMGKSPWAIAQDQVGLFTTASLKMNDGFKSEGVNLGANLLYVDAAFLVNRSVLTGATYGFYLIDKAICTTASALDCTSATLVSGSTATQYVFADNIHLTPACQQQLGDYAYDQLRARW